MYNKTSVDRRNMQIHLSDISSSEGMAYSEALQSLEWIRSPFSQEAFRYLQEPIELTITNTGDRNLEIRGTVSYLGIPCDRCLEEVSTEIPLEIERKLDMKLTDEDRVNDLDESSYLTGMDLDVDQLVYLEVLMSWPLKVLCKEDCKGICSRCGKNLNEGPCGCAEEPKDPRMAAISDIFSKFKEV
ncbi:MAG: YceD family protein [Blautia obeum]